MEFLPRPQAGLPPTHRPQTGLRPLSKSKPSTRSLDFHSKEDLYKQVLSLKSHINDLTESNKKLKTKLASLHSSASQTTFKPFKKPSRLPDTNKKILTEAYSELSLENQKLKHEILSQKKIIQELLKFSPPEYSALVENYRIQSKALENVYKTLDQQMSPVKGSSSQKKLISKYYVPDELQTISEITNQLKENAKNNKLELEEVWYVMNPNDFDHITLKEFINGARALNLCVPEQHLELYFKFFAQKGELLKSDLIKALKPY